nr:hypothetical protein CFP56_23285 [Quercus suber]
MKGGISPSRNRVFSLYNKGQIGQCLKLNRPRTGHPIQTAVRLQRNTAKSDVIKIYRREKENLKHDLKSITGRFCLTSDLWSSPNCPFEFDVMFKLFIFHKWKEEGRLVISNCGSIKYPSGPCQLKIAHWW